MAERRFTFLDGSAAWRGDALELRLGRRSLAALALIGLYAVAIALAV